MTRRFFPYWWLKLINLLLNVSFPPLILPSMLSYFFSSTIFCQILKPRCSWAPLSFFSYPPCLSLNSTQAIWTPYCIRGFRTRPDRSMRLIWKAGKEEVLLSVMGHKMLRAHSAKPACPPTHAFYCHPTLQMGTVWYILFTTFQIPCFLQPSVQIFLLGIFTWILLSQISFSFSFPDFYITFHFLHYDSGDLMASISLTSSAR